MYIDTIFIFYIIAILISFMCLMLIGLVFVKSKDRQSRTYIATRNFAVLITLTGVLYFTFYYREVVQDKFEIGAALRVTDYLLCDMLFLCWYVLLANFLEKPEHDRLLTIGIVLTAARIAVSAFFTIAFMGPYYNIDDPQARLVWAIMEAVFIAANDVLILYYGAKGMGKSVDIYRKRYIAVCSALLLIWSTVQGIIDSGLLFGRLGVSAWNLEIPDATSATMFLLNLATCIFVFKEDFSPLFLSDREAAAEEMDLPKKLDLIAESHKLTVREREVLELLYNGETNPDIADALYISINTVKKHTHNIYEKFGVNGRMEAVKMINSWKIEK